MKETLVGPPKDRILDGFTPKTKAIIDDFELNKVWQLPAQRAISAVLFWMQDNHVTKRALASKLGITEQAMGKLLKLDHDFRLSTIGRLAAVTGLDLFSLMAVNEIHRTDNLPNSTIIESKKKQAV